MQDKEKRRQGEKGIGTAGLSMLLRVSASPRLLFILSLVLLFGLAACNSNAPAALSSTRIPTQTPWVIYVPVTTTPEPATITPLPSVTPSGRTAARTPTRAAAAPTKAAVVAPTKAPTTAPAASVPTQTKAAACPVTGLSLLADDKVRFPGTSALRQTPGPDTFIFKFTPFQAGEADPKLGYEIDVSSKRTGFSNGATIYFSHNWFLKNNQQYLFDQRAVAALAGGADVTVTWIVKIVYAPNGFNDSDPTQRPGGLVECGGANPPYTIDLKYVGS